VNEKTGEMSCGFASNLRDALPNASFIGLAPSGELTRFTDDELQTVVGLLKGSGAVWELKYGSWVLAPARAHQCVRAGRNPDVADR